LLGIFQGRECGKAMTTIVTLLTTWLNGRRVGKDTTGNTYYEERIAPKGQRRRRWVLYRGADEASLVPPLWNGWLHYTRDEPPGDASGQQPAWGKEHMPNATGTAQAYRPPGHTLQGGRRDKATGDYDPWTPG
jgi:NADH:ubiquinone oxidoreductase subunit